MGLTFLFVAQLSSIGLAQSGVITTVAGIGTSGFNGDGGPAISAQLNKPYAAAVDTAGNLFIADYGGNRVRKVTPNGIITTVAGNGTQDFGGDGGPATSAQLSWPSGVAVDTAGNLFIADFGNVRVRKVTPSGIITTVAGIGPAWYGTSGFGGDGGPATSAQLDNPHGVALDSAGNLFIADQGNNRVRKVTPNGIITTVAGNGTQDFGGDGGPATSAQLFWPSGVAVDTAGNLFIADYGNQRVRKVTPGGVISTVAGIGSYGFSGDGRAATAAQLYNPSGVALDSAGNLFIADYGGNRVRKVTPGGVISTVAGIGSYGFSGDGGWATAAQLYNPSGVAVDSAGNLFIADYGNNRLRKVALVAAGPAFFPQVAVGGGCSTLFTVTNTGLTGASGNIILTDQQGNPFVVNGGLTDSFGTILPPYPGSSFPITVPVGGSVFLSATALNAGDATKAGWARLESTGGSLTAVATYEYVVGGHMQYMVGVLQGQPLQYATIPVDNDSTQGKQMAYAIANPSRQTISVNLALMGQNDAVVNNSITVTLSPGQQISRYLWQDLALVQFKGSLVLQGQNGQTFVAVGLLEKQGLFTVIPLITQLSLIDFAQSAIITTVAGGGTQGLGDGGLATAAQLYNPWGVAVDSAGNLFIGDEGNNRVRKVTSGGVISTVAGIGSYGFSGDGGPATAAQLSYPGGVAVDSAGNLFIGDSSNNRVRKVTPGGVISTVAGNGTYGYSGDGGPATAAQLYHPSGVAVDTAGNLFIADYGNARVRKVTPGGVISTVAGGGTQGLGDGGPAVSAELDLVYGVAVDSAGDLFIADYGNKRVRKVTPDGVITTVAGNGTYGYSGDGGPATAALLYEPSGVAVDTAGNLFITDFNYAIVRKVRPDGLISTVTGIGTWGFSGDGGPATSAQLAGPGLVAVDSAGNLFIADTKNNRVRKVALVAAGPVFFPQVAVGGGYSTLFTVTNTGSTSASGSLILTDQQGNPFPVNGTLTDSSGITQPPSPGYSFSFTVPAGGTIFLSATGLTTGSPVTAGWGQLQSTGGSLNTVATYEYVVGSILQTMVGVLQSQPLQYATIPVDNDTSQSKQMVYAIANPSNQNIAIKLALVGQDGTVVDDTVTVTLLPGQQIARYLWQDLARTNFKGSLVLRGQSGATFIAVALVEKQGLLTVIPLVSGKAPGVPN
jgi:sugar lactone lactonase YvrE